MGKQSPKGKGWAPLLVLSDVGQVTQPPQLWLFHLHRWDSTENHKDCHKEDAMEMCGQCVALRLTANAW